MMLQTYWKGILLVVIGLALGVWSLAKGWENTAILLSVIYPITAVAAYESLVKLERSVT